MTDTIKESVDRNIDNIFHDMVREYDLRTGDIAPEQVFLLDELKDTLTNLVGDYVHGNLPESEE